MKTVRKQEIVMAYVLATKGRLPDNLDRLLGAMRTIIGDVSESEVRAAIAWALRQNPAWANCPADHSGLRT